MKNNEHDLQVAAVNWFRYQYPQYAKLLFAIPNGGQRHIKIALDLKAEGVLSGVFDLFLALPKNENIFNMDGSYTYYPKYHGLFIETKFGNNRLTANQKEFSKQVNKQGYLTAVYYNIDEFMKIINDYLR